MSLPKDSAVRKRIPIFSGVINYFPDAIAAVAQCSQVGNDQHNPGEPLHWAKEKSTDHQDCIARHQADQAGDPLHRDPDQVLAAVKVAWRALAHVQTLADQGYNVYLPEEREEPEVTHCLSCGESVDPPLVRCRECIREFLESPPHAPWLSTDDMILVGESYRYDHPKRGQKRSCME